MPAMKLSEFNRPHTLVLPPVPYAVALYGAWWLGQNGYPWPLPLSDAETLGWALVGVGLSLFAWTLLTLWRHHTTVNPYRAAHHLCIDGPFAFSRNPIYVGDWVIYLGVMLILHTAWPLLFAPLVWVIIRYGVIRHEEAHLTARFDGHYLDYKARVRRWL